MNKRGMLVLKIRICRKLETHIHVQCKFITHIHVQCKFITHIYVNLFLPELHFLLVSNFQSCICLVRDYS
jgi:hypothetical protein